MVNRFLRSMETGDSVSAASQGKKLLAMDSQNSYIEKLVAIQQSNSYVERIQKEVNVGNVTQALTFVEDGLRLYPTNRILLSLRGQLRQLTQAKIFIDNMRSAESSSAMSAALTAAMIGLSSNHTPKLESYFKQYRQQIADVVAKEQAAVTLAPEVIAEPDIF